MLAFPQFPQWQIKNILFTNQEVLNTNKNQGKRSTQNERLNIVRPRSGLVIFVMNGTISFIIPCASQCFPIFIILIDSKVDLSFPRNLVYLLSRSENNERPTVGNLDRVCEECENRNRFLRQPPSPRTSTNQV